MTRKIQRQRRARKQKQHLGKIEERAEVTSGGKAKASWKEARRRSGSNWQKVV